MTGVNAGRRRVRKKQAFNETLRSLYRSRKSHLSVFRIAFWSCITGTLTGLLVALFRLTLERADLLREVWVGRARSWHTPGLLLTVAVVAALTAIAAALVRRLSPHAAGSGIPHVEAVAKGELSPASLMLVPVKFIGGVLAIGSGLALGREGPSVQMGAGIGVFIGKRVRLPDSESIALLAACAGAGIATAFNAPIAGAVFVLEELIRRFDTRTTVAALGCSCCAIAVSRLMLGRAPDFQVPTPSYAPFATGVFFLALGVLAGLLGAAYNRALIAGINFADRLRWPVELRAAVIGAIVGAVAWFAPDLVGGGDPITQRTLLGDVNRSLLPLFMCLRFVLGPLSYAAATPGGLFAPMLTIGAEAGLLFATICSPVFPNLHLGSASCAVVGMAAFFYGGCARTRHRYCSRDGVDRKLYTAHADAVGMFRGHGRTHSSRSRADLRVSSTAGHAKRAEWNSRRRKTAGVGTPRVTKVLPGFWSVRTTESSPESATSWIKASVNG